MACSSCGKARVSSSYKLTRNSGATSTSGVTVVNSQTISSGDRVQTAVASNPNSPKRTKI